jgi:uncharacterized protein (TIGR03435 family)
MARASGILTAVVFICGAAFCQSPQVTPKFDIADVHAADKLSASSQFPATSSIRGGRYEFRHATMVDLVSNAYGVKADKVIGGPSWLEMDKFDITAKIPPATNAETAKLMLRSLLEERFGLVVHDDTKPVPAYVLTASKKPLMKEAAASDDSGCKLAPPEGGDGRGGPPPPPPPGAAPTFPFLVFTCHNMTMAKFADEIPGLAAAGQFLGDNPVADQTGLTGAWDFSFKYNFRVRANTAGVEIVTLFDAMEKQLGLKLEPGKVPLPVLVVDKANETPTANSPEVAKAFPPVPLEFEVADVKPSDPDGPPGARLQIQPGGRIDIHNLPLKFLIEQMWNISDEMIINAPKFMDTDKWDIVAKAPSAVAATGPTAGPNGPPVDIDTLFGMLKTLMAERFKLAMHTEERPLNAYTLLAGKPGSLPKMKKADPASRTHCVEGPPLMSKNDPRDANPVLGRLLTCQNITMKQFAEQLQFVANGYVHSPVLDSTGLEGGWDFTLNFSTIGQLQGRGGDGPPAAAAGAAGTANASDPNGALSLNDAIEKQLGLKLELQKRPVEVLVIDHVEQKPLDN